MIPLGFTAPPNDFENFSDQISDVPRLRRYNIRDPYRACRISEQMAAETIEIHDRESADETSGDPPPRISNKPTQRLSLRG